MPKVKQAAEEVSVADGAVAEASGLHGHEQPNGSARKGGAPATSAAAASGHAKRPVVAQAGAKAQGAQGHEAAPAPASASKAGTGTHGHASAGKHAKAARDGGDTKPAPAAKAAKKAPAADGGVDGAEGADDAPRPQADGHGGEASADGADIFFHHQRELLLAERNNYTRQAEELKAQAEALALEHEPGDVQFDEEGGEGGTANVDRELDLHLSAQAQAAVEEIDLALAKLVAGTYGTCENCGTEIPRARLEALPHARLCVTCKSGGLAARRQ